MVYPGEPEIIPPRTRRVPFEITDAQLEHLASLLDDVFRVPGTSLRFGLDPLIGLIPGLGDFVTGAMSFLIIYGAWQRGLPRVTMARMFVNIAIDTLLGIVPVAGDAFDVVWKSNRMNYDLLMRAKSGTQKSHSLRDWLFLITLALGMAALIVIPFIAFIYLVRWIVRG
jgi:hypothetical protein